MRLIAITGMHRSGTSLTTRIVNLLGVPLGPAEDHTTDYVDNPTGHWESQRLLDISKKALGEFGGSWDDPPTLGTDWVNDKRLEPLRIDATAAVSELFGDLEHAAWKDPRTALLMPFWRSVAPIYRTIVCIRHPEEVAASLAARNGFAPERSARLWLRYMAAVQNNVPEYLLVDYASYFEDLPTTATSIAQYLKLPEPDETVLDELSDFLDERHRHHDDRDRSDGPLIQLASAIYREIRAAGGGQTVIGDVLAGWQALDEEAAARVAEAEAQIASVEAQIASVEAQIASVERQLDAHERTLDFHKQELDRERERTRSERDRQAELAATIDQLRQELTRISGLHHRALVDHARELDRQRAERDQAWAEAVDERTRRRELQTRLDRVMSSRTMRSTRRAARALAPARAPIRIARRGAARVKRRLG